MLALADIHSYQGTVSLLPAMRKRSDYNSKAGSSKGGKKRTTISFPPEEWAIIDQARSFTGLPSRSHFVSQAAFEKASAILEARKSHSGDPAALMRDVAEYLEKRIKLIPPA